MPKIGDVRVKWSRALPSVPSTVTVVKDAAGRYFASFVVESGTDEPLPAVTPEVGIDLGLTHFAILSDGTKIDSSRFLRRAEKKLKKAQRDLPRKAKGSANRAKARLKVARAHARTADARREFHHQLSTKIIRENRAVAVEDLAVRGLARTRLAKSVHDAGWSKFVTMLECKATRYGRTFTRIGRFEPTSQVCSQCGVKDGPKPLNVRTWTCGACGAVLDRDINAAVNVAKAAGLAISACGARLRPGLVPAQRTETGTHRDGQPTVVGIPSPWGEERKSKRPPAIQRQGGAPVRAVCEGGGGGDVGDAVAVGAVQSLMSFTQQGLVKSGVRKVHFGGVGHGEGVMGDGMQDVLPVGDVDLQQVEQVQPGQGRVQAAGE
ncbi:hypothetical protein SCHAM137S_02258 [Streptomyces chartreusis]